MAALASQMTAGMASSGISMKENDKVIINVSMIKAEWRHEMKRRRNGVKK